MIKFMVLAAPRSGTAWASNWLTTDKRLCIHDPLFTHHYEDLDAIKSSRELGVSCTGLALFPDFVNKHPARKVILHRDLHECSRACERSGLPPLNMNLWDGALDKIHGVHLPWTFLFKDPVSIWKFLFGEEPDMERHRLLCSMKIERTEYYEDQIVAERLSRELRSRKPA